MKRRKISSCFIAFKKKFFYIKSDKKNEVKAWFGR